ncbi:hypothetical protein JCGZ_26958 [Jatropha curcas]|uniref:AP2/ERF domain-containing protein n=2 Tax=Jatropha curcas TaxID=180498 RepID=A0A067LBS1_JATCU|nr:hypothetical protein JCGZ_26958 [Jatropha curcas]
MAAIEYRGLNAVTNFDLSRYIKWLRPNSSQQSPNSAADANLIPNPTQELGLSFTSHQQSSNSTETTVPPPWPNGRTGGSASSALGLLLQSSKFKEMLERTSAGDCPLTPPESEPRTPPSRSFPDDIQTYFECEDSGSFAISDDDIIFGDLNTFASPIFDQCCEFVG